MSFSEQLDEGDVNKYLMASIFAVEKSVRMLVFILWIKILSEYFKDVLVVSCFTAKYIHIYFYVLLV